MPDGATIKIRRKDDLLRKLRALAPALGPELQEANRLSAHAIAETAKGFAPVKSGALKESIVVTPPGGSPPSYSQGAGMVPEGSYAVSAGNGKVRYAHLVEFGSKPHTAGGEFEGAQHPGAPAQAFFWPAVRLEKKRHKSKASRAINKAVKKVVAK